MRKYKLITLRMMVFLMVFAFVGCSVFGENSIVYIGGDNEIIYDIYAFIPYGDTEEALGFFGNKEYKELLFGPNSFAVSDNGDIYILDTVNDKIKKYNFDGEYIFSLDLPQMCEGIDMEVLDETIYVMCDGEEDLIYSTILNNENSNYDITWTRLTNYSVINSFGLYRDDNHVYVVTNNGDDICLTCSDDELDASRTIVYELFEEEKECHITENDNVNIVDYIARPMGMYFIKNNQEYTYILEKEGLMKHYPYAENRIGKYKNGTKIETALGVPAGTYYTYSNPFKKFYISEKGIVYQMVPSESGVTIYIIPWNEGHLTRITEEMILLNEGENLE